MKRPAGQSQNLPAKGRQEPSGEAFLRCLASDRITLLSFDRVAHTLRFAPHGQDAHATWQGHLAREDWLQDLTK